MALCTAEEARTQIPSLSSAAEDTLLEQLIAGCGETFARYCGYPEATVGGTPSMEATSYTEYSGDGFVRVHNPRELVLSIWPVLSVTSIHDDADEVYGANRLVAAGDYGLRGRKGETVLLKPTSTHGSWSRGRRHIKATWSAGYATATPALKRLVAMGVRNWFDLRANQGKESSSQDKRSVSFRDEDFLPELVTEGLASFRLPGALL